MVINPISITVHAHCRCDDPNETAKLDYFLPLGGFLACLALLASLISSGG